MAAPTPSPLRRMALGASVPKVSKPQPRSDAERMPPPPPPPTRPSRLGTKRVLDEEEYVKGIDSIIERDFFPDLPLLHRRARWMQLHGPGGIPTPLQASPAASNAAGGSAAGRTNRSTLATQLATPISEWGDDTEAAGMTPLPDGVSAMSSPAPSTSSSRSKAKAAGGTAAANAASSLTDFVRKNTSEDHESFQEVLESDQEKHRRRYFWAFDGGLGANLSGHNGASAHQLLLLNDGSAMSAERRAAADAASDPERMLGDERPAAPEGWKHRVRNQLMFGPDLATSLDTCGVPKDSAASLLLLTNGNTNALRRSSYAERAGKKAIQHHATRFPAVSLLETTVSVGVSPSVASRAALESPNSERSSVIGLEGAFGSGLAGASGGGSSSRREQEDLDAPVPMTPLIEPGMAGDSPMMTWGEIAGTPMILDPSQTPLPAGMLGDMPGFVGSVPADGGGSGGQRFRMNEQPRREALAHELEASASRRQKKRRKSPSRSAAEEEVGKAPLTPAARAFAARLRKSNQTNDSRTPFGGAMLATPKRAALGGGSAASAARGSHRATPLPSPMASVSGRRSPVRGNDAAAAAAAVAARGGATAMATSRVTDGLLKI